MRSDHQPNISDFLLHEVRTTWKSLGTDVFYHKLKNIGNIETINPEPKVTDSHIYEILSKITSKKSPSTLIQDLRNCRKKHLSITEEQYKKVLSLVSEEFEISEEEILLSCKKSQERKSAVSALAYILYTSNKIKQKEISILLNRYQSHISTYISYITMLSESKKSELEIIQKIKSIQNKLKTA